MEYRKPEIIDIIKITYSATAACATGFCPLLDEACKLGDCQYNPIQGQHGQPCCASGTSAIDCWNNGNLVAAIRCSSGSHPD